MPNFTAMDLPADGNALKREDLYSDRNGGANGALYDPAQALTMERMRGMLDGPSAATADENYDGGDDSIEPWMIQNGALVVGSYWGSEKWTFQYAKQLSKYGDGTSDNKPTLRVIHGELTKRLFLPWDAGTVIYGYQGWFRQDATWFQPNDGTLYQNPEYWDIRTKIRGTVNQAMYTKLPFGRETATTPDFTASYPAGFDPGIMDERRWRWVSKASMLKDVSKGYLPFEMNIGCQVYQVDRQIEKLHTPSCGAWVVAFR